MEHWSIEKYREYTEKPHIKSKYSAQKTSIDGHVFDSKKEAEFYCQLKNRQRANDIRAFCLQPIFVLADGLKYRPDFIIFNNDNSTEVVDVKGVKTKEYIAKKKMFEDKYNLIIKEI